MNRTMKRTISVILATILLLGSFSAGSATFAADTGYQNGDVIAFGSYPQSLVTDSETVAALDVLEKEWVSYGYLSAYVPSDYMRYADLELNGQKYRAVITDAYRPNGVGYGIQSYNPPSQQKDYGFKLQTVYYYAYDPILWIVMDAEEGYLLSRDILAQQDYCSGKPVQNPDDGFKYRDNTYAHLLSDWATSDVRTWLNGQFLDDAFTTNEAQAILVSSNNNQPYKTSSTTYPFETAETEEKVFLPSKSEVENYKDLSGKSVLYSYVTDYAQCQGQYGSIYAPAKRLQGDFLTRTANSDIQVVQSLLYKTISGFNNYTKVDETRAAGTRPALRVDLSKIHGHLYGGACGRNMTWEFADGELVLRGNGLMTDYESAEACPWYAIKDQIQYVYAWDGINSIAANAFADSKNLREVFFEQSVRTIKKDAFSGCDALRRVTVMADVISANSAFQKNAPIDFVCRTEEVRQALQLAGFTAASAKADDNKLTVSGTISVSDAYPYYRAERLLNYYYKDVEYLQFEKLVFEGVPSSALAERNRGFADESAEDLTLKSLNVYLGALVSEPYAFTMDTLKEALRDETCAAFPADSSFGKHIEFGSYPQTEVDNAETLDALNALEVEWTSYRYYRGERRAGAGDMFAMHPDDIMFYTDVELDGERYRGVKISSLRPLLTWDYYDNGSVRRWYSSKVKNASVMWFRYEPITWRVLDADDGLIFSENVLDNQPFENMYYSVWDYEYRNQGIPYPAIYAESSVRTWLNETFWQTAFSAQEQEKIQLSVLETPGYGTRTDLSNYSTDKVFLLSFDEATNPVYGFSSSEQSDPAREVKNQWTNYAFSQGPVEYDNQYQQAYFWWTLRTGQNWNIPCKVMENGSTELFGGGENRRTFSLGGIRPAMRIDPVLLVEEPDDPPVEPQKPVTGTCGENVQWAFDEESGVLSLTGTGAMGSLGAFEDYGYSIWQDDIQFVAAADGVTTIGAHAFEGCPILEEVILGEDVTVIGEAAFTDCPRLMNVTLLSGTISADDAFPDDRMDWMLIFPNENVQAIALAKRHGVAWITVTYADDTLSFGGTITVHDGYAYSYLPMFVQRYGSAQKVYFNRLVFADIRAEDVAKQEYTGSTTDGCLTMYYVEVTLVYVSSDGEQRNVTYDQMIELLQSGDYRAFKLRVSTPTGDGEEKTREEIIYEKLEEILPFMPRKVLRLVSKAINFIVSIFKK